MNIFPSSLLMIFKNLHRHSELLFRDNIQLHFIFSPESKNTGNFWSFYASIQRKPPILHVWIFLFYVLFGNANIKQEKFDKISHIRMKIDRLRIIHHYFEYI